MKNVEWQFTIYVEGNKPSLAKRKLPDWVIGEINTYTPARTLALELWNTKNTLMKSKSLLQNHWVYFNQTWHKASLGERDSRFYNKDHLIMKKEMIGFLLSKSTLWYNHRFEQMCLSIWTGFSGERCSPWASCWNKLTLLLSFIPLKY